MISKIQNFLLFTVIKKIETIYKQVNFFLAKKYKPIPHDLLCDLSREFEKHSKKEKSFLYMDEQKRAYYQIDFFKAMRFHKRTNECQFAVKWVG